VIATLLLLLLPAPLLLLPAPLLLLPAPVLLLPLLKPGLSLLLRIQTPHRYCGEPFSHQVLLGQGQTEEGPY
jgi:hypothetical protein